MAADFSIKQSETLPYLNDSLTYSDGSVVNLTGATVKFIMRSLTATLPTVNAACTVVSAIGGTVRYAFSATDTATTGRFQGIWQVTFSGGQVMSWPTVGSLDISVEENITTPGGQQLASLGEVKDYLNIPASDRSWDAKLLRFLEQLTPVIEHIVGDVVQKIYTNEMHDGGSSRISLLHHPVVDIVTVTEYLGPVEYHLNQIPTGRPDLGTMYSYMFEPDRDIVRRGPGGSVMPFFGGTDSVSITYTAGLTQVPPNIVQGVCELARVHFQLTQQGRPRPGGSQVDDDEPGRQIMGFFVPNRVRELLAPNRRHPSVA